MARHPYIPTPAERRQSRRRLVIGGAAAAGGAVGAAGIFAARRFDGDRPTPTAAPTALAIHPVATSTPATPASPAPAEGLAIEHASVAELGRALDSRDLSVRELIEGCLARIAAMDGQGPTLGAVIEVNPDALEIADARDRELASGKRRGPLHGIPVLAKDLFATADAMATTAGSLALVDNVPVRDAFVIDRLRKSGAIVLGKTNMSEWGNFRGANQTSGWSARGGQTRNPYQLDMSPWGSSSGSAVAVSAGYAPLALGVETDGSIICPASASAVVGLKPTVGLVSRSGVIPISFSQDSPGPMTRTVEDAAYLLSAIAGFDPEDPAFGEIGWSAPSASYATSPVHAPGAVDYTRYLDADGLRGARLGVARNVFSTADAGALVEAAFPTLEAAGATIVDPANIPSNGALAPGASEYEVLITEFPYALESYLATYTPNGPMLSLADIIAFNEEHADEELVYFDQVVFYRALDVASIWDVSYQNAVANNMALARNQGLDAVLDELELDALIAPTTGAPTPISLGGDDFPGACSQVSAIAGYPIISVPIGHVDGLPVGMSFMGRAFSEPLLLKLAYAFEQAYPVRRPPEYREGSSA